MPALKGLLRKHPVHVMCDTVIQSDTEAISLPGAFLCSASSFFVGVYSITPYVLETDASNCTARVKIYPSQISRSTVYLKVIQDYCTLADLYIPSKHLLDALAVAHYLQFEDLCDQIQQVIIPQTSYGVVDYNTVTDYGSSPELVLDFLDGFTNGEYQTLRLRATRCMAERILKDWSFATTVKDGATRPNFFEDMNGRSPATIGAMMSAAAATVERELCPPFPGASPHRYDKRDLLVEQLCIAKDALAHIKKCQYDADGAAVPSPPPPCSTPSFP